MSAEIDKVTKPHLPRSDGMSEDSFDFTDMIERIAPYTMSFVLKDKSAVHPMGSGTWVNFSGIEGVLTAAHVLEKVLAQETIGVMCYGTRSTETQSFEIDLREVEAVCFGEAPWTQSGPDLGFLRIPSQRLGTIKAIGSFANAEKHYAEMLRGEPESKDRIEIVSGGVAEWVTESERTTKLLKTNLPGLANVGLIVSIEDVGQFDVLRFEPKPVELKLPESFKGMSGGGLWRIFIKKEDDGSFSFVTRRLVGVAFYEAVNDGQMEIFCHGPKSIYNQLATAIKKKWPDA